MKSCERFGIQERSRGFEDNTIDAVTSLLHSNESLHLQLLDNPDLLQDNNDLIRHNGDLIQHNRELIKDNGDKLDTLLVMVEQLAQQQRETQAKTRQEEKKREEEIEQGPERAAKQKRERTKTMRKMSAKTQVTSSQEEINDTTCIYSGKELARELEKKFSIYSINDLQFYNVGSFRRHTSIIWKLQNKNCIYRIIIDNKFGISQEKYH